MRAGLLVAGVVIILIGFILTITVIGAIIGVPLIIAGIVVFIIGLFTSHSKQQIIIQQHVGDKNIEGKKSKK